MTRAQEQSLMYGFLHTVIPDQRVGHALVRKGLAKYEKLPFWNVKTKPEILITEKGMDEARRLFSEGKKCS